MVKILLIIMIIVLSLICMLSAVVFAYFFEFNIGGIAQRSINEDEMARRVEVITKEQSDIHLTEITPFIWDEAFCIVSYAKEKDVVAFLGEKSKLVNGLSKNGKRILGSDHGHWVMFFNKNRLVIKAIGYEWSLWGDQYQYIGVDDAWMSAPRGQHSLRTSDESEE